MQYELQMTCVIDVHCIPVVFTDEFLDLLQQRLDKYVGQVHVQVIYMYVWLSLIVFTCSMYASHVHHMCLCMQCQ